MTPHWAADNLAERLITAGWSPELGDPEDLQPLERGFGSDVYAIPGTVVVRVARSPSSQQGQAREQALLAILRTHLSVEVPTVVWSTPPGPALAFGAVALSWVSGETPTGPSQSPPPDDLVEFMASLHSVPREALSVVGLPDQASVSRRRRKDAALATRIAKERWPPDEVAVLGAWLRATLAAVEDAEIRPVPRHGDLWWANLRVCDRRLRGVLDWENCAIADPAEDVATQLHVSEEAFEEVVHLYRRRFPDDTTVRERARHLFGMRELMGIRLCIEAGDQSELDNELAELRRTIGLG